MSSTPVTKTELQSVAILSLGFGLVGIDRFLISTMYPTIAKDLHLNYSDIGIIAGALAISWGIAALFMGNYADKIGHRRVLVGSLIAFSLMIGASGLAAGLGGLVLVRIVMGFADGAYTPSSIAATVNVSPPARHGRNVGMQQTMVTLFGLGFAPILVTYLFSKGVDWRYVFSIFLLPGLIVAWATWRIIPAKITPVETRSTLADWRATFQYRNIRLLMLGMFCWLTTIITLSVFLPNYLLDHLHMSSAQMGAIMPAIGFGSVAGNLLLGGLSDRIGRKPVMVLGSIGTFISLIVLSHTGANVVLLTAGVFSTFLFVAVLIVLTVGPITSETVPFALMTTATGMVIAAGELLGGGLAPIMSGFLAKRFGIDFIFYPPIILMAVGIVICCALTETYPHTARRLHQGQ